MKITIVTAGKLKERYLSQGIGEFLKRLTPFAQMKIVEIHEEKMKENLDKSLMLVTALNPHIGYEKSAQVAKRAHEKDISLKEAAVELGFLSEEEFDEAIKPEEMV